MNPLRLLMRRPSLFMAAPGFLAVVVLARYTSESTRRPIVIAEGSIVDVGEHYCGGRMSGNFTIVNRSDGPTILKAIRSYCGCVSANAGHLPRSIQPGERLRVDFELDARDREEAFEQRIDLLLEDSEKPVECRIRGRTLMPLAPVTDLGSFTSPTRQFLALRQLGEKSVVRIREARLRTECKGVRMCATGDALEIDVHDLALGSVIDAMVDVEFQNGPVPSQSVRVTGIASGGLTADPCRIVFGRISAGHDTSTQDVVIQDKQDVPFDLGDVVYDRDILNVVTIRESPCRILCRVSARAVKPRAISEQIALRTTDGRRAIILQCVGMAE